MNHFLSIVLRNQFNLFYRFGYTFIPKIALIAFNGAITDDTTKSIVETFATITPFDYEEEYLILHFEKSINEADDFVPLDIQDLVSIYPLSGQAKISIESKIDQRIRLEFPLFESILPDVERAIHKKEVEQGISAIWTFCKIDASLENHLSRIGLNNILKGLEHRKNGTRADRIKEGNYWEYLLAYDRFDYFPNSTLGSFYDAGQVFAWSKGLATFEGSGVHRSLEKLLAEDPSVKLPAIIKYLETEHQSQSYVLKTTADHVKQYIVAPLYLMLRDEIRKSEDVSQTRLVTNVDYLKQFKDSFYDAVILLGAFFGFRKFYDFYYDTLNLRFYKSHHESPPETKSFGSPTEASEDRVMAVNQDTPVENEHRSEALAAISSNVVETEAHGGNLAEKPKATKRKGASPKATADQGTETDSSLYKAIIEELFKEYTTMRLTEISAIIKKRTEKKLGNGEIKDIITQMSTVEVYPKMKPETAGRKISNKLTFDSTDVPNP